jgi:hypothetical protein
MNNVASGYSVSRHQGIANVPMRQFGCSFLTNLIGMGRAGDGEFKRDIAAGLLVGKCRNAVTVNKRRAEWLDS